MTATLAGLGLATPELAILQSDAAQRGLDLCVASEQDRRLAPRLYSHSGVHKRHCVLLQSPTEGDPIKQSFYGPSTPEQPLGPTTSQRMAAYRAGASDLAERAARRALAAGSVPGGQIDHLVYVTCSGFDAPGVDIALIDRLDMRPTVARTNVGFMGCHGALNGLRVAKAYCEANPSARVLVVAVELCSLHYQYAWTPERIVANSLFADGAAAAVVTANDGPARPRLVSSYSQIVPGTLDAMSWGIGDHGFEMTLSARAPQIVATQTRGPITQWLESQGLQLGDIRSWAIHPGGPRILSAAAEALDLRPDDLEASRGVLHEFGNMSSPTVLFVAERLLRTPNALPCVLIAFGPGMTIEATLLA